ncbi:MAG: bifunctional folylpolyglutamate synthase/dihydrofolate synthase [Verrucomicrobiota bacterium]|nr:bifunctional folylpolyglutamate synthase/dihydrofolate synthase [Verrucomicrobiota bacterium]
MNYAEALAWLYGTQRFGIKLGLENAQRLLRELNVPGKTQRIIHVAGTNGKGSVCAIIDSICRAAKLRTGLFTSPHLVTYRERIRVNGEMIAPDEVARGLSALRNTIREWDPHPTFFEITTTLALDHFKKTECEVIVLETGLGGRLDATNALLPVVSVITPISYDHERWLGHTLDAIAGEKAGIIKPRVPVVSAKQDAAAEKVIRARASHCEAPLEFVTEPYMSGTVSLAGKHQRDNAALAVAALRFGRIRIPEKAFPLGLAKIEWPARFQRWDERTIIDGAHNPAGARVLAETWREQFGDDRATIILAVLREKNVAGIGAALAPIAARFILPPIRSERALPPDELSRSLCPVTPSLPNAGPGANSPRRARTSIAPSFVGALEAARALPERILITGSLHFAGEALATLDGNLEALEDCAQ